MTIIFKAMCNKLLASQPSKSKAFLDKHGTPFVEQGHPKEEEEALDIPLLPGTIRWGDKQAPWQRKQSSRGKADQNTLHRSYHHWIREIIGDEL